MIIVSPYDEPEGFKRTDSGLLVPDDYDDKPYPLAFDFFAGAGGFSCGLVQGGFDVIGALEWEPAAAHTYMSNLCAHPVQIHYTSDYHRQRLAKYFENHLKTLEKNAKGKLVKLEVSGSGWISHSTDDQGKPYPPGRHFIFGDIRETTGTNISAALGLEVGELDLVVGGPPCQGYSNAGKRQIADPRNNLVFEYARLICELAPKSFVMENVPGIVTMETPEGVNVVDQFLRILEDGNYMAYEAGKKALGIREKLTGKRPRITMRPPKSKKSPKKTPAPPPPGRQGDLFK